MKDKKIVELLKGGNFTILYHDKEHCSLYRGRYDSYEEISGSKKEAAEFCEFDDKEHFLPKIVSLLVDALGGRCDSV
ncbi:MAG: hypothetical protein HQ594_00880 [Candidatus Omnitrophica bacterium]|nr:hypothetical protein [Candidatus Omnitrophota bacterium]